MDIWELFQREEEKRAAETRVQLAQEKAEWDALTPEMQKARIEAVEAKYDQFTNPPEAEEGEAICDMCGADIDEDGCRFCDGDEIPED